jgi:hypothetical protein
MLSFSTHASQAQVTTGLIADQYSLNFDLLDSNLRWNIFLIAFILSITSCVSLFALATEPRYKKNHRGNCITIFRDFGARGSVVVKAIMLQTGRSGFQTWWVEWIFSLYLILPAALDPGVYSTRSRKNFLSRARPMRRPDDFTAICETIV